MRDVRIKKNENLLLQRLPAEERGLVASVAERVELAAGEVLCAAGEKIRHVYFPIKGVVSLFARLTDSPAVGVGMIRANGMFGVGAAVGKKTSHLSAVAQGPGGGDRIPARAFQEILRQCPTLRTSLFAHADAVATQMSQNAACNAVHTSLARVARWMLDVTEGSADLQFVATQEAIAAALGLQRPAVNSAAAALKRNGHIGYLRGNVSVLDVAGLRTVACNCSIR